MTIDYAIPYCQMKSTLSEIKVSLIINTVTCPARMSDVVPTPPDQPPLFHHIYQKDLVDVQWKHS